MASVTLGSLIYYIRAKNSDFDKKMKQTESRLDKFSKKAEQVGKKMTKYLTVPIATLATTVSKFGMDFEDSMNQSLAIMDNVSDKMRKRMENTARQVALTVDKSAKEAAESYFYLASAGLDAEQSIAALPEVAQFATAGQFDMAKATDLLTDAQSALGLSVEDASQNMNNLVKVSDVLVKANTLANASVEQFSEALTTKAGAALKTANKSLEEGVAVLAAFADQGIKGQAAGEQFSIAMRYLQEAAINNKEALQEYNVEIFDSTGKMRNMADIVGSLENALDGMSDEQKAAALQAMGFSARVQNVIKVLLGLSDEIRNYEEELNNAGGITDKVAKKQMESMLKQLGLLKDGAIDAALSLYDFAKPTIGEVVIPAVQTLVEKLRDISDWFGKLDPNIQKVIGSLLLLSATIGPLTWTFGKLSGLVGLLAETNVAFAFRAWAGGAATASEAIGFLANAFKPFLIGGTVIVGIKLLYDYLTKIRNEVFGLGKDVNTMNLQQVDDNIAKVEKRLNDLRELFAKRNINPEDYEEGSMAYLNLPSRMRGFIDQYNQMTKRQKELKAQREQLIKQQELLNRLESGGDGDSGGGGGLGSPTQNLSDYQKAINDFEHTMAMGGMSLEDQLSTLSDLYNILTDKQDALNKGIEIDMTEKELASAMTELEERMYSITEEIHKKAIDTAVDDMADSFSRGETNIEDYISFLEKKLEDVQKNENLSYDTREQYAQQFNDRIMQLEYQRETGIQSLNKKFADKQYKLDADKLDNKKRTLNQERDDIKEQYKELLGNTKEYEEKAKEIDDLYRRLRLQAEKEYLAEIEAENDRIMDYKYQSNEISLKEYKSYLEERLIQFKKYSTEWISIKNKLDNLESGGITGETTTDFYGEYLMSNMFKNDTESSFNWLTDYLVDVGYKIEDANQAFLNWKDNLSSGLTDVIVKGESFLDVLNNIAEQIASMIITKGLTQPFTDFILGGIGLSGTAHTGGVVTVNGLETFHTGGMVGNTPLKSDEKIIKTKVGEIILNEDQQKGIVNTQKIGSAAQPNVNVEVVNNTGTPVKTRSETQFDGTRTVVRMFMEGYARNMEGVQDVFKRR